jgi:hypothetical protein
MPCPSSLVLSGVARTFSIVEIELVERGRPLLSSGVSGVSQSNWHGDSVRELEGEAGLVLTERPTERSGVGLDSFTGVEARERTTGRSVNGISSSILRVEEAGRIVGGR